MLAGTQNSYSWPNFREAYLRTPPSRPYSKMEVKEALHHKREHRMRKNNNRPTLVPPWVHSQIEQRQEKQRHTLKRGSMQNMQPAMNVQTHEQVDMYGNVRGKGQRLLSNGQVLPVPSHDPSGPYTYSREEMFKYEPTDRRVGTPLRAKARAADPSRPMIDSSGYVMNTLVEHPYFLDINGAFALPTPAPEPKRLHQSNILKINHAKTVQKPKLIAPEQAWAADKEINAKRRQSRSYWQRTSWPGCLYTTSNEMAMTTPT